ncbi:hypothetical protein D7V88_41690 [Corallococcus terminator]|uniref:Uncharacterized protein n=1 Tax=Corallococcus terminator TaxID=2316733 RepID=A0A3A8H3W5_9BACT|nr:hypothetical protein D7V88_41690 [Corallococcus terminator]
MVGLCIVPAVMLLLAGPALATSLAREPLPAPQNLRSLRSNALELLGQARRVIPHRLPLSQLLLPGPR